MFTNPSIALELTCQHHGELLADAAQQRPVRSHPADSPAGHRARRHGLRAVTRLRTEPRN